MYAIRSYYATQRTEYSAIGTKNKMNLFTDIKLSGSVYNFTGSTYDRIYGKSVYNIDEHNVDLVGSTLATVDRDKYPAQFVEYNRYNKAEKIT